MIAATVDRAPEVNDPHMWNPNTTTAFQTTKYELKKTLSFVSPAIFICSLVISADIDIIWHLIPEIYN